MKYERIPLSGKTEPRGTDLVDRLERQLEQERKARLEAEAIAERGLRELYESQVRLALLQRITDFANQSNSFAEVLDMALKEICLHMGWEFGNGIRVSDNGRVAAACDTWFASEPDRLFPFVEASRAIRVGVGDCLPGRVLRDHHPHWIDEIAAEDWLARRPQAVEAKLLSACAFPISIGDELVAVIEFFSSKPMIDKDAILLTITQSATQLGRVIERERARATLLHDALHDAMTGLPNRVLLDERCRSAFQRLSTGTARLAIMVIDLDGFKAINDKYGHHAGDALLVDVTGRFQAAINAFQQSHLQAGHATLARVGGDEFVILLDSIKDGSVAEKLATLLHDVLRPPTQVDNDQVTAGASIGIALSGPEYDDVEQIRRDADLAMYEAKASGSGHTVTFTDALGTEARNRMALERELREAIRDKQFLLFYQPIFALTEDQRLMGYEALIRWQHPTRGLLDPGAFIDAAEQSGLIVFIGDWVLRQGCTALASLHKRMVNKTPGCELPFVSINIAPQQFLQPSFAQQVQRVLIETGVPSDCLRLEVTEGVAIIDADRTRQVLEEIRAWGVRTSLDDFGTGYSSLSYLQNLPFDTLKIDRSFVASIEDPKSRNIIRAILDLANNLNLSVVAEGIESPEQGRVLVEMGCEFGQGFHLGVPLDEKSAFALIDQRRAA
ncbi:putative bifunctional diguanylate cyclase/phosphodiesterase [Novosphingobium olei]|uniref:Sensor domain-containing phosphodiesterase n=1 Tax=Novosphingobium olei TaxID=2728851 RepID=A0A7Y0BP86_9SPHN|nr:sensor domain-containing phosphodiesterase [Novosphingobium olei]NML94077.1 sensor domain-containing phosphodiesterase [Novosphingobium olei]